MGQSRGRLESFSLNSVPVIYLVILILSGSKEGPRWEPRGSRKSAEMSKRMYFQCCRRVPERPRVDGAQEEKGQKRKKKLVFRNKKRKEVQKSQNE